MASENKPVVDHLKDFLSYHPLNPNVTESIKYAFWSSSDSQLASFTRKISQDLAVGVGYPENFSQDDIDYIRLNMAYIAEVLEKMWGQSKVFSG